MRDSWIELVDSVLRPARPRLAECLREGDAHRAARRVASEERARRVAHCERRIEEARRTVFAANDGVVPGRMTELEREWRRASRSDRDGGLMELWARIAPSSWLDRKRWRDSDPDVELDVAIALAADPDGVEAAEAAIGSLAVALSAWGTRIGPRIRWCPLESDADSVTELLGEPHRAAREAIAPRYASAVVLARAEELERAVGDASRVRFPERPLLAWALGHAALVDCLLGAARLVDRPNPVTPLRELWKTGYALLSTDASSVTLGIPPLP